MAAPKIDQSYPTKSTVAYVIVALVIDVVALVRSGQIDISPMLVFSAGGVLICIPWGILGVVLCIAFGAMIGALVGGLLKYLFRRYQPSALRLLVATPQDMELALVLVWAVAVAVAYHLAELVLYPGQSGALAAANALLGRALILPELNDLYWLAARRAEDAGDSQLAAGEATAV